jgi:serine/threonine-protein phosphatase 2A regulatory subunit B'
MEMLKKIGAKKTPAGAAKPASTAPTTAAPSPTSAASVAAAAAKDPKDKEVEEKVEIPPLTPEEMPTKKDLLEPVPSFRDVAASDRQALFVKKLRLCCVVFNFNDSSHTENLGREMKRQILLELVDHISTSKKWFSEVILREFIRMVSINLFRSFPPVTSEGTEAEEEEPALDPSWPHLQIVYEFLLRFVVSTATDAKLMKRYINGPFVLQLLDLFKSDDPRERDYLKTILHRIYGKFMSLRLFIRKAMQNVFSEFIYDTEKHSGIGEILEILGSIINGFALPLKEEHKSFLKHVLLPLHKARQLSSYHQQLSYCVTQFIDKDPKLAPSVITGLLNFWPVTNSAKEVLFLNELEEVLELTQAEQFQMIAEPLFRQIAKSISSKHFQVAERALFLWNNEYISSLTTEHRVIVLPILYPALHKNSKQHWNQTVHTLTFNVIRMCMEMDAPLFESVAKAYTDKYGDPVAVAKAHKDKWDQVAALAASAH